MAHPVKLSGVAFERLCRSALRRLNKLQSEVNDAARSGTATNVTYQRLRTSLTEGYTQKLTDLDLYKHSSERVPDLSEERLEEGLNSIDDLYGNICLQLDNLIASSEPLASSTILGSASAGPISASSLNAFTAGFPTQSVPKFSGNQADWSNFFSRFSSIVDSSEALSALQKFQYLIDSLTPEAQRRISHLEFRAEQYPVALALLRNRYENPRRMAYNHATALLKLPQLNSKSIDSYQHFLDDLSLHYQALVAMPEVDEHSAIVMTLLTSKLDSATAMKFEAHHRASNSATALPKPTELLKFLHDQLQIKQAVEPAVHTPDTSMGPTTRVKKVAYATTTRTSQQSCHLCHSVEHKLQACPAFTQKNPKQRFEWVKSNKVCVNCLGKHKNRCSSSFTCRVCHKQHHTLLHFRLPNNNTVAKTKTSVPTSPAPPLATSPPTPQSDNRASPISVPIAAASPANNTVLLATALVTLRTPNGAYRVVRALIDTAAGGSFVSEHCAQLLNCTRSKAQITVQGVGPTSANAKGTCTLSIASVSNYTIAEAHPFIILPKLTQPTPQTYISPELRQRTRNLILADPTFDTPSKIDCILGAELFSRIFTCEPPVPTGPNLPVAIPSLFGYIIMGSAPTLQPCSESSSTSAVDYDNKVPAFHAVPSNELHALMEQFWVTEEPPAAPSRVPPEAEQCEQYFRTSTIRQQSGQYQVRLPFIKADTSSLRGSHSQAYTRFLALERRFTRDPEFKQLYVDFMSDYLKQGHMVETSSTPTYYIPHHGIFKKRGDTSKIRVVFDASAKPAGGTSLNELLYPGPKLQPLLSDIITLFRRFPYVFSCDIMQMFRQIKVHPDDWCYQAVLWRDNPGQLLKTYLLTTVTYGTRSAPYLALRTLAQLAEDESAGFPKASEALTTSVFVDDICVGAYTLPEATALRDEVIALLATGGFTLRKWVSNHPFILDGLPSDHCITTVSEVSSPIALLGTHWDPKQDTLSISAEFKARPAAVFTKRRILSTIAQIFDPCGWLSPFTMTAKCFIQRLWGLPLDWDTPFDSDLVEEWSVIFSSFSLISSCFINRPLPHTSAREPIALHGFCDASKRGYAAVLYLCASASTGPPVLLVSKTRVAPLKTQSIPRLELCGAHLLALLTHHYYTLLSRSLHICDLHLWTDSQIVLRWISIEPHKLKTFAANRVAQISEWVPMATWHHVTSGQNPADLASRGTTMSLLSSSSLWWHGPEWLPFPSNWPSETPNASFTPEEVEVSSPAKPLCTAVPAPINLFAAMSSWPTLLKVVKIILTWRYKASPMFISYQVVVDRICLYIQRQSFGPELRALQNGTQVPVSLRRLTPFLDPSGLIRVGGRLALSTVVQQRHPILLPKAHPLVALLIRYYHIAHLHAGLNQVLFHLSQRFWIISARQAIRTCIFKCVTCFRSRPSHVPPLMGQLPAARVNPSPPFYHTGMDFAGPFTVRSSHLRKAPLLKVYLCLFVCFATKAVHLELATSLSTPEFINVLNKLIARRGCPAKLYSDCGTNFVGASVLLRKALQAFLQLLKTSPQIEEFCNLRGITFNFNPPAAPHQGGLWERVVRSTKFHLNRVLKQQIPTFVVLQTLVIRIEGILNSRPITPMSSDPSDYSALTPGHFLIGRPLLASPESDLSLLQFSPPSYRLLQSTIQSFWNRWRRNYLPLLHPKQKWTVNQPNLKVGDLVLLDEPNTPISTWPLARILEVYEGSDGVVRQVKLRTSRSSFVRPVTKLYKLPIH
ncbi:uncharacterized protein isoform X2 [Rhodnius prolixus]|uniref:uncharacterized protein isoform X2 n=1 Tax=Rhodnius prolixus TaxID=13249 RepID=UPI003D18CB65